ncbi:MAG: hypothetical protein ACQEXV_22485 [Bacillota bacterium]
MNNILYFEGAGMDYETNESSNVGNYRIRTAFVNNEGVRYFLELSNAPKRNDKGKIISEWALYVGYLFEFEDTKNDSEVYRDSEKIMQGISYTNEAITAWINRKLNCSFDTIQVLDMFYGYRVHGDHSTYNLIDNHDIDHEVASKRKAAYEQVDKEYRKALNEKYTQISLLEMDNNSITIECYASDKALGDLPRIKHIEIV